MLFPDSFFFTFPLCLCFITLVVELKSSEGREGEAEETSATTDKKKKKQVGWTQKGAPGSERAAEAEKQVTRRYSRD